MFLSGGTLNNEAGATISGVTDGVQAYAGTAATVINAGLISGSGDVGVFLQLQAHSLSNSGTISGGHYGVNVTTTAVVTNAAKGVISGGESGIWVDFQPGSVVNSGTITGSTFSDGIDFLAGGTLTNARGGVVSGGEGVVISGTGVVANAGSIGGRFDGVRFYSDGNLTNAATGIISGGEDGVSGGKGSTATNSGAIIGTYYGAFVVGLISNRAGATITGGAYGVEVGSGGTIINAGTIAVTGTRLPPIQAARLSTGAAP